MSPDARAEPAGVTPSNRETTPPGDPAGIRTLATIVDVEDVREGAVKPNSPLVCAFQTKNKQDQQ